MGSGASTLTPPSSPESESPVTVRRHARSSQAVNQNNRHLIRTNEVAPIIIHNCREEFQHVSDFKEPIVFGSIADNMPEHALIKMDGEEEWSDWSDTDLLKIHNYYELNGGQSTDEPHHTTSASQNQHTKSPGNGDNESNHCLSEESESGPSNISSEQSSSTIRDRPSQHDDIPGNGRNETNACRSNTSEIELSSTLTEQSSANTTKDISGENQDENMQIGPESTQVQHEDVQSNHQSILLNNKTTAETSEHRTLAGYTSNDSSNDDTPLIKLTKNKHRLKKQDALRKSALKRLLNAKRYINNVRDKRTKASNMTPVPRKKLYHFRKRQILMKQTPMPTSDLSDDSGDELYKQSNLQTQT
ncbi:unnamed protein product [Mytilus coruscus]|uniref:Uncharacterized protein n=1 Tax=Mytilus coruscus TaxID=42192 RepID=A0A6J8C4V2_MYTCO|nr:unnamed protein product [Mytilus coruscus]